MTVHQPWQWVSKHMVLLFYEKDLHNIDSVKKTSRTGANDSLVLQQIVVLTGCWTSENFPNTQSLSQLLSMRKRDKENRFRLLAVVDLTSLSTFVKYFKKLVRTQIHSCMFSYFPLRVIILISADSFAAKTPCASSNSASFHSYRDAHRCNTTQMHATRRTKGMVGSFTHHQSEAVSVNEIQEDV